MQRCLKSALNGLIVCLGITIVTGFGFAIPQIMKEILHPTASFGGPINRYVAQLVAAAIGIAATVETLLLGILLFQRWISRSLGVTAMLAYGTIALLSLLSILILLPIIHCK